MAASSFLRRIACSLYTADGDGDGCPSLAGRLSLVLVGTTSLSVAEAALGCSCACLGFCDDENVWLVNRGGVTAPGLPIRCDGGGELALS
jgi:hypothetical protein